MILVQNQLIVALDPDLLIKLLSSYCLKINSKMLTIEGIIEVEV